MPRKARELIRSRKILCYTSLSFLFPHISLGWLLSRDTKERAMLLLADDMLDLLSLLRGDERIDCMI